MQSGPEAKTAPAVYGLCAAALLGVCALIWSLGALSGRDHERNRSNVSDRHAMRAGIERRCATLPAAAAFDCAYALLAAAEDTHRAETLTAQRRTAWAAAYAAAATALIAAVLALALWSLRRHLVATTPAIDESRRIGEAQVRCYLSVAKVIVDFTDHNNPVVSCRIVNNGQSPALHVRWHARLAYDAGQDGHLSWSTAAEPAEPRAGLTIAAADSAIPRDIALTHDLTPGALRGLASGTDMLVLCIVTLDAIDVFDAAIHQRENFVGKLDTRLFTNPLVTMEPYGGDLA